MIREDSRFCDQNLQSVAILYEKFKIYSSLILLFSKIFYILTCHSAVAFQRYQICQIILNAQKVIMVGKMSIMNKTFYFRRCYNEAIHTIYNLLPDVERRLLSLPPRMGGLDIPILSETADFEFENSRLVTETLTTKIINHIGQ